MPEFKVDDFSAGWIPSDSPINGRKNGLIKMENVELAKGGGLSLMLGTEALMTLGSPAHSLYSVFPNENRLLYFGCEDGTVKRNAATIASGGSTTRTAFCSHLNNTLICSGDIRIKDDGATSLNLGLTKPTVEPTVVIQDPYTLNPAGAFANFTALEGTLGAIATEINITTDATTFRAKVENIAGADYAPLDLNAFSSGFGTLDDIFKLAFKSEDSEAVSSVRVEILLETPASAGAKVDNYFFYDWQNRDKSEVTFGGTGAAGVTNPRSTLNPFNKGLSQWSNLECRRRQFQRAGYDTTLGWDTVRGIRFSVVATAEIDVVFDDVILAGGSSGSLKGLYQKEMFLFAKSSLRSHKSGFDAHKS